MQRLPTQPGTQHGGGSTQHGGGSAQHGGDSTQHGGGSTWHGRSSTELSRRTKNLGFRVDPPLVMAQDKGLPDGPLKPQGGLHPLPWQPLPPHPQRILPDVREG